MPVSTFLASDEGSFHRKAAQLILESSVTAIEKRGRFSIALSGGETPKKLFALLTDPYFRERLSWDKWHVFWGDERCVPSDSDDSNFKAARDALLSRVPIPASHIHRMAGEVTPAMEAARAYEREIHLFFQKEPLPRFDVMLLGVGDDGHTASLFPGTSALDENERWVTAVQVDRLKIPARITMTFPVLNVARRILILCSGDNKAAVVRDVFHPEAPLRYPIQRVKSLPDGEVVWLLDKAAVSKLPPETRFQAVHLEKGEAHA